MSLFRTRAWALIREEVLRRDGHTCRMLVDGHRCGARATTVNHIVRREHGGTEAMSNLEAACGPCNYGDRPGGPPAPVRLTVRAALVVSTLDAAGAPVSVGRRRAIPVLAARHPGVSFSMGDIDRACRYRRARGPLVRL